MKENIRNIFDQNIQLLKYLDRANYYFRIQQYDKAISIIVESMSGMKEALEAIIRDREYFHLVSTDTVTEMLTGILNAQKKRNYILLADLLELQLISFLCGVQELIISKEEIVFDEEKYLENLELLKTRGRGFPDTGLEKISTGELLHSGYRVEFTSTGLMTLVAGLDGSEFYFHTNSRIYSESILLAGHWYCKDTKTYVLYGFGMGYHVEELLAMADEAVVEVYEADLNVMKLACAFQELKELLSNDRLKLIYDPGFIQLRKRLGSLTEGEQFQIHYPSLQNIRRTSDREMVESFLSGSKS